jgi:hypothetical protein
LIGHGAEDLVAGDRLRFLGGALAPARGSRVIEPGSVPGVRQRVALAIALGLLFVLVGVVVVPRSSGGDTGEETSQVRAAIRAKCVKAWNGDEIALEIGAHAATAHGYTQAWVTLIGADGKPNGDGGGCALVFPASQADPERQFGGTILVEGHWLPLSRQPGIDVARLSELQAEALESANANLYPDGSVHLQ